MRPPGANNEKLFDTPAVRSIASLRARAYELHIAGHANGRFACPPDCRECRERVELEAEIHAREVESRVPIRNDKC
jgi:hypothetical protein